MLTSWNVYRNLLITFLIEPLFTQNHFSYTTTSPTAQFSWGNHFSCRSQWPRGLRRRYAAAHLLRSWVRIPPGAWMFVCCGCCVLSGRGLCDELITRPEESYRLWCIVACDLETARMRRPWPALGRSATAKKNWYNYFLYKIAFLRKPIFIWKLFVQYHFTGNHFSYRTTCLQHHFPYKTTLQTAQFSLSITFLI